MIPLQRLHSQSAPVIRVLGIGGAGGNALDRLTLDGFDGAGIVSLNTDVQALNGCVAPQKIQLGRGATRGLGAGGDPEVGYQAAEESADEIKAAVDGADIVFLLAGLGGGTGSGVAPLIAHIARSVGALVIAFVTMPFAFEGKRRIKQAADSLAQIEQQADLVVTFENDRLGENSSHKAGVQDAFLAADQILSQSITAIASLVRRGGIIPTSLDTLAAALRSRDSRCLFGHGESDGTNRVHDALTRALKNPLMDRGKMLADCQSVVIHVAGGPDLTVHEVTALMEEFNKHISDDTRIDFGLSTDQKLGRKVSVTIISSTSANAVATTVQATAPARVQPAPQRPAPEVPRRAAITAAPEKIEEQDTELELEQDFQPEPEPEPAPAPVAGAKPAPSIVRKPSVEKTAAAAKKEEKAEQMTLEPANRGRFEKSEPTIVDGQDLDVPTFLRKNLKVK